MTTNLVNALIAAAGNVGGSQPPETGWDISNLEFNGSPVTSDVLQTNTYDIKFSTDGVHMYLANTAIDTIDQYSLSTPWDPRTATFVQSLDLSIQDPDARPYSFQFKPDGTVIYIQNITYNTVVPWNLSNPWDISTAVKPLTSGILDISAEEASIYGMFISTDGANLYICGVTGDAVVQYTLNVPWDVTSAVYLQETSVAGQDTAPSGIYFAADGLKMYMVGTTGDDVYQYSLSTAWDISTLSYTQNFPLTSPSMTAPAGIHFKPDGSIMYVVGYSTDDVNQYTLSTPWDITTASHVATVYVNVDQDHPSAVFFKSDGTRMFVFGEEVNMLLVYDLTTPWDISTAGTKTYEMRLNQTVYGTALYFKPDGTVMYSAGLTSDNIYQSVLLTPWDPQAGEKYAYVGGSSGSSQGMHISADGLKLYSANNASDNVSEFSLSTAWDTGVITYVQDFNVNTRSNSDISVQLSTDGTRMFLLGQDYDNVTQYNLSTPWDISTAIFEHEVSVGIWEETPEGVCFSPDGAYFYVVGTGTNDKIRRFKLNTAWELSTLDYRTIYTSAQEAIPRSLYIQPNGQNVYITGSGVDGVTQYSLAIPWDLNTATFVTSYSTATYTTAPYGVSFSSTGTVLHILAASEDSALQFTLSTPWDVSTASYTAQYSVSAQEAAPYGMYFRPDGLAMYISGATADGVTEYSLTTAWDITTASFVSQANLGIPTPYSLFFKSDGKRLFLLDGAQTVYQYSLTTAWDATTAVYDNKQQYLGDVDLNTFGLFFKSDGTKMYSIGYQYDSVYEWDLV